MRVSVAALLLASVSGALFAQTGHPPKLLLTQQRLRRLKRDRERQTVRWVNFETRIREASDSPERGFELALYYAVTGDEKRGREALDWGIAHPCQARQRALIADWAADLMSDTDRSTWDVAANCSAAPSEPISQLRDDLFIEVVRTGHVSESPSGDVVKQLKGNEMYRNPVALYAACEYLMVTRSSGRVDLREQAPEFFSDLPEEFLLALKPREVTHPDWATHVAALALVALDPNLQGSQYLQAWALEDAQMVREGPGVAYELLWGDPYLPGVGYQNLDPWVYDGNGHLFARSSWNTDACWISISAQGTSDENCPHGWQASAQSFGRMILIPMTGHCAQVPHHDATVRIMFWHLEPNEEILYGAGREAAIMHADTAGLLHPNTDIQGKICRPR